MVGSLVGNADYVADMRGSRVKRVGGGYTDCVFGMGSINLKRKRDMVVCEDDDNYVDVDYAVFLRDLEEFVEVEHVEEDEDDPEYVMFFKNLKEWGVAYMLDDGVQLPIIYEDSISGLQDSDFNNRMAESLNEDVPEKRTQDEVVKRRKLMSHRSNYMQEERNLNVDNGPTSAPNISPVQAVGAADEVYSLFLSNVKVKENLLSYKYGDSERVYYERTSEHKSVVVVDLSDEPISVAAETSDQPYKEVVLALPSTASAWNHELQPLPSTVRIATQRPPTRPSTVKVSALRSPVPKKNNNQALIPKRPPAPPLDKRLDNNLKGLHRVPSKMREKLNVILRNPYNKQEHETLWKELNFQSPVLVHRDSRSGGSDRPRHMGRSLLDWYPDLRSEIEKVNSNPHKVLNLLRMLSYYIQKQPCGNICKPWLDDSLTSILPRSA